MKKTCLLFLSSLVMMVACTKNTTTNNITTPLPAFTVNGIHDVSLTNGTATIMELPITVQYSDSSQEVVTLSLSSLPAGLTLDTTWITSGIPTYTTSIIISDTTLNGATPGTYPMTLTAAGSVTGAKTYPFNIKVHAQTACTTFIVGKYADCSGCSSFGYTDSVYADPTIVNRIWFTNFNNTGNKVYAQYNCSTGQLTIPSQISGGITYAGSGNGGGSITGHSISLFVSMNGNSCDIDME